MLKLNCYLTSLLKLDLIYKDCLLKSNKYSLIFKFLNFSPKTNLLSILKLEIFLVQYLGYDNVYIENINLVVSNLNLNQIFNFLIYVRSNFFLFDDLVFINLNFFLLEKFKLRSLNAKICLLGE